MSHKYIILSLQIIFRRKIGSSWEKTGLKFWPIFKFWPISNFGQFQSCFFGLCWADFSSKFFLFYGIFQNQQVFLTASLKPRSPRSLKIVLLVLVNMEFHSAWHFVPLICPSPVRPNLPFFPPLLPPPGLF